MKTGSGPHGTSGKIEEKSAQIICESESCLTHDTRIRILHFIYTLRGGGAERQLVNLANSIDSKRFATAICCANRSGSEELSPTVEIFLIPRNSRFDLRWSPITRLITQWKPDIIHNWLPVTLLSSLVPARSMQKHIRYVASYRGSYRLNSFKRLLQAFSFYFVDDIVSNTHVEEQLFPFNSIFRMKSGVFIPNGIDLEQVQTAETVALNVFDINVSLPIILFAGRLTTNKNVEVILEAISELHSQGKKVQLLVCGTGSDELRLRSLTKSLGLGELVKFVGYQANIYGIMKACNMLILPSFSEGMPNALFEAMAVELPVIVSEIPVHQRWVTDGVEGLLFAPGNAQELADCITNTLCEGVQMRKQRIANAKDRVRQLSLERTVSSYEDYYLSRTI